MLRPAVFIALFSLALLLGCHGGHAPSGDPCAHQHHPAWGPVEATPPHLPPGHAAQTQCHDACSDCNGHGCCGKHADKACGKHAGRGKGACCGAHGEGARNACCGKHKSCPKQHEECPPPVADRALSVPHPEIVCLEKSGPAAAAVGQALVYEIVVRNTSCDVAVANVVVTDIPTANLRITGSEPPSEPGENGAVRWRLGEMGPGETRSIRVNAVCDVAGQVRNCATVSFDPMVCIVTDIYKAELRLTKSAMEHQLVCDPVELRFVVSNPGTGPATNVRIEDTLPAGWATLDGKTALVFDIGTLCPGESREVCACVKGSATGEFTNHAAATADGGLRAEAETKTVLHQPVLAITKTGRAQQYLGNDVTYEIEVRNTGDWVAHDTVVEDVLENADLIVSAEPCGQGHARGLCWPIGDLAPGDSRKMSITVRRCTAGTVKDTVTARAYCAKEAFATVETVFQGIPALLLEVVDQCDPVEIGGTTTYVITVTNQGSQDDTQVVLAVDLEANEEYVSSTGATPGTVNGGSIVFAPVGAIPPQASVSWSIVVKAVTPGDVRFKAQVTSAELTRPVQETESTHLYK